MAQQGSQQPRSQPAARFDPYRALQLHPRAPHDLVEQVYWALTAQARDQIASSAQGVVGRVRSLNNAYAILVDPDRRTAYDAEHKHAGKREKPLVEPERRGVAMLFARSPVYKPAANHYEMLAVDVEATRPVIDLAYQFRMSQMAGALTREKAAERDCIDQAYTVLREPQRRAQYDGEKMRLRRTAAFPETAAPPPDVLSGVEPAVAPVAAEPVRVPGSAAPAEQPAEAPPVRTTSELDLPPMPEAPTDSAAPAKASRWPFGRKTDAGDATDDGNGRAGIRLHIPNFKRDVTDPEMIEAERARLRELGMLDSGAPAADALDKGDGVARARFVFVDGPLRGEHVDLRDGSLILGSSDHADVVLPNPDGSIGAGHVRVWHRDGEFILHQLDAFSTTFVNEERLDLRLVILEPGDRLQIGPHTLVFEPVAAPAQAPEPQVTAQG